MSVIVPWESAAAPFDGAHGQFGLGVFVCEFGNGRSRVKGSAEPAGVDCPISDGHRSWTETRCRSVPVDLDPIPESDTAPDPPGQG